MFTGIVESKAKILSVKNWHFEVENSFQEPLKVGQSIAHDGACMTLEKITKKSYSFFVMEESLGKTNFWTKNIWDFFNVERCLQVGDRIDGHFVSGHIDTTGKIIKTLKKKDDSLFIFIEFPKKFRKFLIEKWSVTINWVSLTVVDLTVTSLSISLIPLTQKMTNLWILKKNDIVNLEFDMLGKYILNKTKL